MNLNNYKKMEVDEVKKISLEVLDEFSDYCEKRNLDYYLACGTLLGSIRHKGFIPWDDDIDVMMPRSSYEKFLKEYNSENYDVLKPSSGRICTAKLYDKRTIKIEPGVDYKKYRPIGIDIDIFPLDGIINDDKIVKSMYKKQCFLEMLLRLSNQPLFYRKNPIKCINRIIPRIIGSKNIVKMIEKNQKRYDYDSSDYVVRMKRSLNGFTGALNKKVYEKEYKEFEGKKYVVPKGYDTWLTTFFGDYMKLPPKEKQVYSHNYECYKIK